LKVETQGLNDEFAFAVVSSTKIFKTPGISVYAIILLLFGVGFILSRKVRA
jgi:hypothetical protein